MRPTPVAAGFQLCRPGSVSRAANSGSSAIARRDILRTMPLAVVDLTNSRREILIVPRLSLPERLVLRVRRYPWLDLGGRSASVFGPVPGVVWLQLSSGLSLQIQPKVTIISQEPECH